MPQLWRQAHDLDRDAGTDRLVFTVVSTRLAGVTNSERIDDRWLLTPADRALVMTKRRASRLGFAVLLTFFGERGRFPRDPSEIEAQGIAALSRQLDIPEPTALLQRVTTAKGGGVIVPLRQRQVRSFSRSGAPLP